MSMEWKADGNHDTNKILIETCCASAEDVIRSERAGADRAELNACLRMGGLTPSLGALKEAVERTSHIRILTMVRPREGGFRYSDDEFRTMLRDAELFLENGAAGIVFGFLNGDGTVDEARTAEMLRVTAGKEAVFHRAIDVVPDWRAALDSLIRLGVDRVLTSGQKKSAFLGRFTIREMNEFAAGRIQILPGAGIRDDNAGEILKVTGCDQLHMSHRIRYEDPSLDRNPEIRFSAAEPDDERIHALIDDSRPARPEFLS